MGTDGSVNSRGSVNKPSKVLQYRRTRAQHRKKNRLIAALVLSSTIVAVVYTKEKKRHELVLKEEQERRESELALWEDEMTRPWTCNVPFSYLVSKKCWRVASKNPIYDCGELTDYMME